ncbi:unnamed protein product [Paramecium octaurelia]|uniref:Uncharacterized protein n=1 Tax=Paramecium octaurelia TaxID=43137 RepID=A0A8S1WHP6_PAROT|nr:unnamed protein product [Paramecium octaurelia]
MKRYIVYLYQYKVRLKFIRQILQEKSQKRSSKEFKFIEQLKKRQEEETEKGEEREEGKDFIKQFKLCEFRYCGIIKNLKIKIQIQVEIKVSFKIKTKR